MIKLEGAIGLVTLKAGEAVPAGMIAHAFDPTKTVGEQGNGTPIVAATKGYNGTDLPEHGIRVRIFVNRPETVSASKKPGAKFYDSPR